jgi:hypothetical protein
MLYRVDVNSSDTGTLFIAGIPEYINLSAPRLVRTSEASFRVLPVTGDDLHYEVSAFAGTPLPEPLPASERGRYLRLPPVDTRTWNLAREWSGQGSSMEKALRIQGHLRREFEYTLETPKAPVRDPLSHFLFVSKRGYCEYFASAMAVMLRTVGVPSRVATGFQSGYFNDVSGLYVIRASDAHAWVEAWIEGRGWVTFDPTPAASARTPGLGERINMYFDAADSLWRQWVVAYDLGHQAMLAGKLANGLHQWSRPGADGGSWEASMLPAVKRWGAWLVALALVATMLIVAGPRWFGSARARVELRRIRRLGGSSSDAAIVYRSMLNALGKRGFEKPAWFTPDEFARHLPAQERAAVARFTTVYNKVRFGGNAAGNAELIELLHKIEQ